MRKSEGRKAEGGSSKNNGKNLHWVNQKSKKRSERMFLLARGHVEQHSLKILLVWH